MTLEEKYNILCSTPSDINEHLPTLYKYASQVDHITEFGVRNIVSTYALLMGQPSKMISYDINNCHWLPVKKMVEGVTDFEFRIGNTLEIEIEPTHLLFIDTLHNYNQLKKELELHADKVQKYIILHDTETFKRIGESYSGTLELGLWPAVLEFLEKNNTWFIKEQFKNNNGLTILERK